MGNWASGKFLMRMVHSRKHFLSLPLHINRRLHLKIGTNIVKAVDDRLDVIRRDILCAKRSRAERSEKKVHRTTIQHISTALKVRAKAPDCAIAFAAWFKAD
jgi:hypothetical protein